MIEESSAPSKWPRVIGTLGVILGVLMVIDTLDDLLFQLFMSEEDWAAWVGSDIAQTIAVSMPPLAWHILAAVIQSCLGCVLVAGSLRVRRRQASGVQMCRSWAIATAAWVVLSLGVSLWWIGRISGDIPVATEAEIEAAAVWGIALAAVFLLAYPVFLLYWFSRDDVLEETATWT
jgi:hypothetical protein